MAVISNKFVATVIGLRIAKVKPEANSVRAYIICPNV